MKQTKNNPGARGEEEKDRVWAKPAVWALLTTVAACLPLTSPFFSEDQAKSRN